MSKLGCVSVAVLLVVQSLALGQSPEVSFNRTELTPGASVTFSIILPQGSDATTSTVHLVLGTATGSTQLTLGGRACSVPVAGQTAVAFSGKVRGRKLTGTFQVPNDPSLIGLTLSAATVQVQDEAVYTAVNPIGPIVEELIL